MRIAVTGSTGFIGSHLVRSLLAAGFEVIACGRDAEAVQRLFPQAQFLPMDYQEDISAPVLAERLRGIDVLINAVGILVESGEQTFTQLHVNFPRCLFAACEQAGVVRIIQISALGAGPEAQTAYHRTKHAADVFLQRLSLHSVVVKPSFVYGPGGSSTALFSALAALPLLPLAGGGEQPVQPIHVDDLTQLITALVRESAPPQELEAVGPAAVSMREMLDSYRQWLGMAGAVRIIPIPWSLSFAAARVLGRVVPWLHRDNLQMLAQGNAGDSGQTEALLGRAPLSMPEALGQHPADDAYRWHARLMFLLPLLRLSVAFVWIFTGLTSAFFYPAGDSYALLARTGISGTAATIALYGAAFLNILIGLAVLARFRVALIGLLQIIVVLGYMLLISVFLPEQWLHPYGPITKNLPFLVGVLILMAVDRK